MKDLADQKAINNYPKMTVLKSLKNVLKQKLIRIIGLFLRRHAFRNEKDIYQKIVYRPVNETEISKFRNFDVFNFGNFELFWFFEN